MNTQFLEQFYETVILPKYGAEFTGVSKWKDHGKVGLDSYAHYFDDPNGVEFVLLNEDFPNGDYLNDDLSHDVVQVADGADTLQVTIGDAWIPNISGYFTLYKEKSR